jgi:peptidyl-prolyl cis-trans isomerase SurA
MKKILFSVVLAIFCLSAHAKVTGEYLDQVVAVVNDDVVTRSELNHQLSLAKLQLSQENRSAPSNLQKEVLDHLIDKKLQLQIAAQVGIHFGEEDIDRIVQNLAGKNNLSTDELYSRINSEGMSTADYRQELLEQMTIQKLQQQQVASRIVVTPDEINTFLRSKLWQSNAGKEYHLEDILISLSDTPSSDEVAHAKKQADAVVAALKHGQTAAEIQGAESNDLGWRKLPEMPSTFVEYVVNMQAHQVAGPIRAGNGFHVLRLVDDRLLAGNAPDKSEVEHLLMQRKFQENVQNWVSKMRSQAFITKNIAT